MATAAQAHRRWMRQQLAQAAEHFSLSMVGEPIFGWWDRTIGSRTADERWLRVSWSQPQWTDGEWWTGNEEAAGIVGVPKPEVTGVHDWTVANDDRDSCRIRAEVMTLITHRRCSITPELRTELELPRSWWTGLRSALDTLAKHETPRGEIAQQDVTSRLLAFFGGGINTTVTTWTTAHNDLSWDNITQPVPVLLDWESWGRKMAGYDAATLYVLSLLAPDTCRQVHETFADVLDSPDGQIAQFYAITRYLKRVEIGDFHNLADRLHRHARQLIDSC